MTGTVRKMLEADPDLNLYLLAFENPELEDEALALARALYGDADTPGDQLAVARLNAKIAAMKALIAKDGDR